MKKEINRLFRRIRRSTARYIVGFDACPMDNRKNYHKMLDDCLAMLAMGIVVFLFLILAVICC